MKSRILSVSLGLLAFALVPGLARAAASDIVTIEKRRAAIATAQQLTRPPEPAPLPPDLVQPFNPPGFDQPDPEELRAAAEAAAKAGGLPPGAGRGAKPDEAAQQPGDHEILETLAAKLPATGTIIFQGEPLLTLGGASRVHITDRFTVTYNGQDYELELVAIDRTTFTLRYHSAEVTRPIKPGKSQ